MEEVAAAGEADTGAAVLAVAAGVAADSAAAAEAVLGDSAAAVLVEAGLAEAGEEAQ